MRINVEPSLKPLISNSKMVFFFDSVLEGLHRRFFFFEEYGGAAAPTIDLLNKMKRVTRPEK
jgi:hypothetical protein